MGIRLIIKRKGLFKRSRKPIPFDIILGEKLQYGTYGRGRLENEHSDDRLTAVLPHAWGRGIWVWLKEDNKELTIALPTPCHEAEVDELFEMVLRIAQYWKCSIFVEGNKGRYSLTEIPNDIKVAHAYNKSTIQRIAKAIMDEPYSENGEPNIFSCIGGLHQVAFGPKEAEKFLENPDNYSEWLHKVQDSDAHYSYPNFYKWAEDNIEGVYDLFPGFSFLLPYQPFALNYDIFKKTGEQAHAHKWSVCFTDVETKEEMGQLPYDVFLETLDREDMVYHDAHCFMLPNLTHDKIKKILECGKAIIEDRSEAEDCDRSKEQSSADPREKVAKLIELAEKRQEC